ncbi:MAG TPA: ROK family protein [Chloroflexota bacterium]
MHDRQAITAISAPPGQDDQEPDGVLAFDIGGTRIKAGLVHGAAVSSLTVVPTLESNGSDLIETIVRVGRDVLAARKAPAVGISIKGIVEPQRGTLLDVNAVLMPWIGRPFAEIIRDRMQLPTRVENDARMFALGESVHGAARGHRNAVCLTLGTGVGCGVILDGRILQGGHGAAGILGGHVIVQVGGRPCTCGGEGCLEAYIGTEGLLKTVRETLARGTSSTLNEQPLTPKKVFEAAAEGDRVAQDVVQQFATYLGAGIVTLVHVFDPDVIVVGGGIAHASLVFLPSVQAYVDSHAWTIPRARVRVVPAILGDAAALVGAAELARGAIVEA